jgi:hypothetical protein
MTPWVLASLFVAHGGIPPLAELKNPLGCAETASTSYHLEWFDTDLPISTGTATVELNFVAENPPTFVRGTFPDTLHGTPIASGIRETDRKNSFDWDVRSMPAGAYWIWAIVYEPPNELGFDLVPALSPGILRIEHEGEPLPLCVYLKTPETPFRFADRSFVVEYDSVDPTGTASVKLEATLERDGTALRTIAEDLPAVRDGSFIWDTSALELGDWTLRATIRAADGRSFSAYARYFLQVQHFPDAGTRIQEPIADDAECRCTSVQVSKRPGVWIGVTVLFIGVCRTRARRPFDP